MAAGRAPALVLFLPTTPSLEGSKRCGSLGTGFQISWWADFLGAGRFDSRGFGLVSFGRV